MLILDSLHCFDCDSIVKMTQSKAEEILEALRKELMLEIKKNLSFSYSTGHKYFRLFTFSLYQLIDQIYMIFIIYIFIIYMILYNIILIILYYFYQIYNT